MGWYITIQQEMRDDLGLKGNELIVFAFINGYSQEGQGCYYGSLAHLQRVCGIASRQTAIDTLKSLVEKGYISKTENHLNGIKLVSYSVCPIIGQGVQKMDIGCPKNGHNNKDIDINKDTIKVGKFNFKSALVGIGVQEDVVDAWLQVRKTKRATNTEIAFNRICEEITKSGRTANECITIAVENSWQGFKASWIEERPQRSSRSAAPRESVLSHNLKVMDQMFGTNLHQQAYGGTENGK